MDRTTHRLLNGNCLRLLPALPSASRPIAKSVAFTTQIPLDHWSEVIADPVIADAPIHDRLKHAGLVLSITVESYRGVKARKLVSRFVTQIDARQKLASKKKDA
jgi:hypothetical protein